MWDAFVVVCAWFSGEISMVFLFGVLLLSGFEVKDHHPELFSEEEGDCLVLAVSTAILLRAYTFVWVVIAILWPILVLWGVYLEIYSRYIEIKEDGPFERFVLWAFGGFGKFSHLPRTPTLFL